MRSVPIGRLPPPASDFFSPAGYLPTRGRTSIDGTPQSNQEPIMKATSGKSNQVAPCSDDKQYSQLFDLDVGRIPQWYRRNRERPYQELERQGRARSQHRLPIRFCSK